MRLRTRVGTRPSAALFVVTILMAAAVSSVQGVASPAEERLTACRTAYEAHELEASRAAAGAALRLDPDSYAASWMLARVLLDLGDRASSKDERRALFEEAEASARRAIALRPDDTWGHHYLSASVGKLALLHGGKTKIRLSKEVRDEALRAIELDPGNDKSLHIMGRWHRGVATLGVLKRALAKVIYGGVPQGSLDEAVDYFRQALAIAPEDVNHHYELGLTLMKMRRYEDAAASFRTAVDLPPRNPNDEVYQELAREQLEKAERRARRPRRDRSR